MADKKINMSLDEIMGDRFGKYSKYIIQERALPDVRDGLKPVQRRILYSMQKEGNVFKNPYRKSAKTVGNVIGNYHPHGDTSVYDAMVRMSQDWKMRLPLIDMQGNNGSIDNDPAAAMRYTEARLSAIASELLRDIDKNTVPHSLNFDDSEYEPNVLPAKYPNLLVNGSTGISAGYATDIPPHNLTEVIDATILRINQPKCSLVDIMQHMKGPDFPTGAIVQGKQGIIDAFNTGKGKVVVRSKTAILEAKNINQIVVTEIPYEVVKSDMVKKIDEIRFNRAIDGIIEVRDESNRNGLRIVVDLKKDVDANNVLNFLYKNTDLQKNYNYNVVAIKDKHPVLMGVIEILDAYIEHQKDVITKRSIFELDKAETREHIVSGLIRAISILDEIIRIIRASSNKANAKENIINEFKFTDTQAEAIVTLQLYRLTSLDITLLQDEEKELQDKILELNGILSSDNKLKKVIIKELTEIRDKYPSKRLSIIEDEVEEIVIDKEAMIISEDVVITVTKDGYVKRHSMRSVKSSEQSAFGKKDDDFLISQFEANTTDRLLLFTNKGNYLYIPVHELEEFKWRETGKHISYLVKTSPDEKIIETVLVKTFTEQLNVVLVTKNGQIKRTLLSEFEVQRYNKPIKCMNLKSDDELCGVNLSTGIDDIFVTTKNGYMVRYNENEVSILGIKASGIKAINLKNDEVVSLNVCNITSNLAIGLISQKAGFKRIRVSELLPSARTTKGNLVIRKVKSNEQFVVKTYIVGPNDDISMFTNNMDEITIKVKDYSLATYDTSFSQTEKLSANSEVMFAYINHVISTSDYNVKETSKNDKENEKEIENKSNVSKEVEVQHDKKLVNLTIDDLLEDL